MAFVTDGDGFVSDTTDPSESFGQGPAFGAHHQTTEARLQANLAANTPGAASEYGRFLLRRERLQEAEVQLRASAPSNPADNLHLAKCLIGQGKEAEAVEALAAAEQAGVLAVDSRVFLRHARASFGLDQGPGPVPMFGNNPHSGPIPGASAMTGLGL